MWRASLCFALCLQTVQYILPQHHDKLSQAELLIIDEAAAIPLPTVRCLTSKRTIVGLYAAAGMVHFCPNSHMHMWGTHCHPST